MFLTFRASGFSDCAKTLTCSGTKVPRISLFDAVENEEQMVCTESLLLGGVKLLRQCPVSTRNLHKLAA